MAAGTKAALIALAEHEFAKLERGIARVDPAAALAKDEEDISSKDVVAHRAHWIGLFLRWRADGPAGRAVFFPANGYKWSELKRCNADLRARQRDLGWAEAREALRDAHRDLLARNEAASEDDLCGGPMPGAKNAWTTGRWAEAAGPSHRRSAAQDLRASERPRLKARAMTRTLRIRTSPPGIPQARSAPIPGRCPTS
ncbi:MAG: ClbS/DfsB family four-helix bundle protein [Caulobacterales bacterium]|nr:ClbS/DfsB family four-helix bundle protein [Caulobacterales bacterium]